MGNMAVEKSLLEQCFARVVGESARMLGRCVDAAISSLQNAENQGREVAERDRLARAWWTLAQQRPVMTQTLPRRLEKALHEGVSDGQASTLAQLSESSLLALVDDSQMEESLESVRLLQRLLPVVEQPLAVLDARMSSLIGLDTVHAEKNPLRPSVFVRVLRDLMVERESDAGVRGLWMQHMAPQLATDLGQLYEQTALMLQRANVQEASYRVRLVADGQSSRSAPLSTGGRLEDGLDSSQWGRLVDSGMDRLSPQPTRLRMTDLGREQTPLDHEVLHAFLAGDPAQSQAFDAPLGNAYFEQVRQELARVDAHASLPQLDDVVVEEERTQFRGLPAVDRPARLVNIGSQLSAERWGEFAAPHERSRVLLELKHQADKVSQAVGLDVVRKLVNQVARDPLLLAPVREAVVALEPALLRLVMSDPRYFNDEHHPARRLIESVAEHSFRYNDEFSPEFEAFFEPVRESFNQLNAGGTADVAPFAEALSGLQDSWEASEAEEKAQRERQLQALQFAEARQELADQIAWEISLRPDVYNVPGIVLDFLYESWSLVLASARLQNPDAGPDPLGYQTVIGHLLWSSKREVTLRQPRQLFDMLPGMLQTLRSGLDMLGKSPDDTRAFFDALLKLHEPVLRLRRARVRADGTHSGPAPLMEGLDAVDEEILKPATPEQQKPRPTDTPWLAAKERAHAGFEDTVTSEHGGLEEDSVQPAAEAVEASVDLPIEPAAAAAEVPPVDAVLASLKVGGWVDLHSDGHWLRAQLIWASGKSTSFMFTSRGGRAHSMTRRSCAKLIAKRWLRPVDARPVVPRALEGVVAAADRPVADRPPVAA